MTDRPHERLARVYWAEPIDVAETTRKYEALDCALRVPGGAEQAAALRACAGRWPASLRESQLTAPELLRARGNHARAALGRPASRQSFRDVGHGAIPLWQDLHALLRRQLGLRAHLGRAPTWAELVAEPLPEPCLPLQLAAEVTGFVPGGVRPRHAYLWLSICAGTTLPGLNAVLFGRAGPWDRRPEDPDWAHDP